MEAKPTEYRRLVRTVDNAKRDKRRKYGTNVVDEYPAGSLIVVSYPDPERAKEHHLPAYWVDLCDLRGSVSPDLARKLMEASEPADLETMTPQEVANVLTTRFNWRPSSLIRAIIRHGIARSFIEAALIEDDARTDDE